MKLSDLTAAKRTHLHCEFRQNQNNCFQFVDDVLKNYINHKTTLLDLKRNSEENSLAYFLHYTKLFCEPYDPI